MVGAEALRSEFERIFFDKHLSRDQILGLWESNEEARLAIERLFGAEALEAAAERLQSFADVARAQRLQAQQTPTHHGSRTDQVCPAARRQHQRRPGDAPPSTNPLPTPSSG